MEEKTRWDKSSGLLATSAEKSIVSGYVSPKIFHVELEIYFKIVITDFGRDQRCDRWATASFLRHTCGRSTRRAFPGAARRHGSLVDAFCIARMGWLDSPDKDSEPNNPWLDRIYTPSEDIIQQTLPLETLHTPLSSFAACRLRHLEVLGLSLSNTQVFSVG